MEIVYMVRRFTSVNSWAFLLLLVAAFPCWAPSRAGCQEELEASGKDGLVVHEWGVYWVGTTRGIGLLGQKPDFIEELPKFVLKSAEHSPPKFIQDSGIVLKPVIHLYGTEGQLVEVNVRLSSGMPIAYYPPPKLGMGEIWTVRDGRYGQLTFPNSLTWKFRLNKEPVNAPHKVPEGNWWLKAREIRSDYLAMEEGGEVERFLFYEGTSIEKPSVTASVDNDAITLKNTSATPTGPVLLVINDLGSLACVSVADIPSKAEVLVQRDKVKPCTADELVELHRNQWEAFGMFPEEANAIAEIWRPEVTDTLGFLLVSRFPEPAFERLYPIKFSPEPSELVRVCLLFDMLVGNDGRKHWLPNTSRAGRDLISRLSSDGFKERADAASGILKMGEVMSPLLNEVIADPNVDTESKAAARSMLPKLLDSIIRTDVPPEHLLPQKGRGGLREIPLP